ncbi:MAG: sugar transferase [Hyphomicrobiaceae bacterium]
MSIAEPKPPLRRLDGAKSRRGPARTSTSSHGTEPGLRLALAVSVDFATACLGMVLASGLVASMGLGPSASIGLSEILMLPVLSIAILAALGLYTFPGAGPCERLRLRLRACALLALASLIGLSAKHGWGAAGAWAVLASGATFVLGYFAHALLPVFDGYTTKGIPTAIIGTGDAAQRVARELLAHPEIGLKPVGFVAIGDSPTVGVELPLPLLQRLDGTGKAPIGADIAVITSDHHEKPLPALPFARVLTIADEAAIHALRLDVGHTPYATGPGNAAAGSASPRTMARLAKRGMDVLLTLPIALLTLPVTLLAILAVRILDPGRAIFVHQRIGKDGRPFGVYKIRTMYQDAGERLERCLAADPKLAEEWRTHFKLRRDPRILPVIGQFLRTYSIDELPQLWNVLLGHMSLVGPRPFPSYHLDGFDPEFRDLRQSVTPGLTGLWQISSRSDGDLEQQKQQDTLYIEHWSLWLDLKILLDTVPAVLLAKGAR